MNNTETHKYKRGLNWGFLFKAIILPVIAFYVIITAINHSMKLVEHHIPVSVDVSSKVSGESFVFTDEAPFHKYVSVKKGGDLKGTILKDEDGHSYLLLSSEKCYVRHQSKDEDKDLSILKDASFIILYQNYQRTLFKTDFDGFCRVYEIK